MFALLLAKWKIAAGLGAGLALLAVVATAHHLGASSERAAINSKIATAALAAEQGRAKADARLRNLSDHDLCVSALQRRGLPIDACSDL